MRLARLQQAIVVLAAMALLSLLVLGLHLGWPGWAVVLVAALCLAPHAPVLALEFLLLRHVASASGEVVAPPAALIRAWWHELLHGWAVFGWRQPFRSGVVPDVGGRPGVRGVVFVHGYVCNRGLWAPWLRWCAARGVPATALSLAPVFGSIDDWAAPIDRAVAALTEATGRAPVVVAHSMGGLAARVWLAADRTAQPVAHLVTIGTPHHGTWLARFGASRNARQMRCGSAWLQALVAREAQAAAGRAGPPVTCFYGDADNIVFPSSLAQLAGADNQLVPGVAHVGLVFAPAVRQRVAALLGHPAD